jgi:PIN domain nuclease of toxin-antitoxin system
MRLLLDTHVWIWSVTDPARLSKRAAKEVRATSNELWLSPISIWEASLLLETKRIRSKVSPRQWIEHALAHAPMIEAPLTHGVAIESRLVGVGLHADPADRFIAATAIVYELVLVTADEVLLGTRGLKTLEA